MRARLYLVTPPGLVRGDWPLSGFLPLYEAALAANDVAAVLLRSDAESGDDAHREAIAALQPAAHAADAALILEYRADLAMETGCDGIHVRADEQNVKALRQALGQDMILGAACGNSKHLAITAAEAGADYVCFGELDERHSPPDPEAISWWAEIMEVPCVALGGIGLEDAEELLQAGSDFLCVGMAVWNHPQGPAAAIAGFEAAIARHGG
ncbi:MAG: thiamine phosphate synthase [Rhodovibrionaceae bacterium]